MNSTTLCRLGALTLALALMGTSAAAADPIDLREPVRCNAWARPANPVWIGSNGPDTVTLLSVSDAVELWALDGKDSVVANGLDQCIYGGVGNDVLDGRGGDDVIAGCSGLGHQLSLQQCYDAALEGHAGQDVIHGGSGADVIVDTFGAVDIDAPDVFYGDDGNDRIQPGGGADAVFAGAHDDVVISDDGPGDKAGMPDIVNCGPGNDRVYADSADLVTGCETVYWNK